MVQPGFCCESNQSEPVRFTECSRGEQGVNASLSKWDVEMGQGIFVSVCPSSLACFKGIPGFERGRGVKEHRGKVNSTL